MKNKLNDYDCIIELLNKNNVPYREIASYNEQNIAFPCIWLNVGHIEFHQDKTISNIITY